MYKTCVRGLQKVFHFSCIELSASEAHLTKNQLQPFYGSHSRSWYIGHFSLARRYHVFMVNSLYTETSGTEAHCTCIVSHYCSTYIHFTIECWQTCTQSHISSQQLFYKL